MTTNEDTIYGDNQIDNYFTKVVKLGTQVGEGEVINQKEQLYSRYSGRRVYKLASR
jgi:hypothetical protein